MKKYLLNIYKINKNISDISDTDNFYDSAKNYITTHKNDQEKLFNSLVKSLKISTDHSIINLIYKILSFFEENINFAKKVPNKVLIKHFSVKSIRNSIISFIVSQKIHIIDDIIVKKLINHKSFISVELCNFINNNPELVQDFLKKKDKYVIPKQIYIIRNSKIDFDTIFYLEMMGLSSKILAFNTYEAFVIYFSRKYNYKIIDNKIFFEEKALLKSTKLLSLESPRNFIKYAFNFIKERDFIIKCVIESNFEELVKELRKIINCKVTVDDLSDLTIDELCFCINIVENSVQETFETNFDHLFSKKTYKNIHDCLEI